MRPARRPTAVLPTPQRIAGYKNLEQNRISMQIVSAVSLSEPVLGVCIQSLNFLR